MNTVAKTRDASLLEDLERFNNDQLEMIIDTSKKIIKFRNDENKKLNSINMPSLTKLSTPLSSLFTPANNHHDEKKAAKLLGYVKKADYVAIEKMLNKNPTLMFIQVKDVDNKNISPLQKAFELYDTYSWKMLYEKIKDQPELVEKFTGQAHQQKEHINLKPLFDAYAAYDAQVQLWFKNKISDTQIDADWIQLGKKQRELLPTHMLREFCREGDSWNKTSAFDANQMPAPKGGRIYNYSSGGYMNLDDNEFSSGFGVAFSLGGLRGACRGGARTLARLGANDASATFSRLCEVRTDDLAKQINMLDQSLQQSPTYKK